MRLINADNVLDTLGLMNDRLYSKEEIAILIKTRTTAYDLDKVMEKLKDIQDVVCCDEDGHEYCEECPYHDACENGEYSGNLAIDKAIEVIRWGGEK